MYHTKLLSAPACWFVFVKVCIQCMYLRTTLRMYVYTCAYACVCMSTLATMCPYPPLHPIPPHFPPLHTQM